MKLLKVTIFFFFFNKIKWKFCRKIIHFVTPICNKHIVSIRMDAVAVKSFIEERNIQRARQRTSTKTGSGQAIT